MIAERGLGADAVVGADEDAVGDGGARLLDIPDVIAHTLEGRGRVKNKLRTAQRQRAPAFREMPVVADIDADLADGGIEHRIAEVAGREVELLVEALDLWDVDLAEGAQVTAVRIDHGG